MLANLLWLINLMDLRGRLHVNNYDLLVIGHTCCQSLLVWDPVALRVCFTKFGWSLDNLTWRASKLLLSHLETLFSLLDLISKNSLVHLLEVIRASSWVLFVLSLCLKKLVYSVSFIYVLAGCYLTVQDLTLSTLPGRTNRYLRVRWPLVSSDVDVRVVQDHLVNLVVLSSVDICNWHTIAKVVVVHELLLRK